LHATRARAKNGDGATPITKIIAISGATRQGVDGLLEEIWKTLHDPDRRD